MYIAAYNVNGSDQPHMQATFAEHLAQHMVVAVTV